MKKIQNEWLLALALAALVSGPGAGCSRGAPPAPTEEEPANGTLTITSEPTGAAVFKDRRERLGKTPLTLERPDGTLLGLTLVKEGHARLTFSVMVEGGKKKTEHRQLSLATGILLVDAGLIKGAVIYVDGVRSGKSPDRVTVTAGKELLVEVKKDRYHPYRERVTVKPGMTRKITAMLLPATKDRVPGGWLSVTCDPPSRILINDKAMGETPLERVPLPARSHRLLLENQGLGMTSERTVTVKENELTTIHVKLAEEADR